MRLPGPAGGGGGGPIMGARVRDSVANRRGVGKIKPQRPGPTRGPGRCGRSSAREVGVAARGIEWGRGTRHYILGRFGRVSRVSGTPSRMTRIRSPGRSPKQDAGERRAGPEEEHPLDELGLEGVNLAPQLGDTLLELRVGLREALLPLRVRLREALLPLRVRLREALLPLHVRLRETLLHLRV